MSTIQPQVSERLVIVKSREAQRAMVAELQGDRAEATKHFLATAYLELVLADDYAQIEENRSAFRSRLSAASCFWRAGQIETCRKNLAALAKDFPDRKGEVTRVLSDLEENCPGPSVKKVRQPSSRKKK